MQGAGFWGFKISGFRVLEVLRSMVVSEAAARRTEDPKAYTPRQSYLSWHPAAHAVL